MYLPIFDETLLRVADSFEKFNFKCREFNKNFHLKHD